ncbi:hypothetical protein D3C81_1811210 [compost metagenome]
MNQVSLEPRIVRLRNENAVFLQRFVDALVKSAFKQRSRRAHRFGRVDHDHVVFVLAFDNMHISVVHLNLNPGVVQFAGDFR